VAQWGGLRDGRRTVEHARLAGNVLRLLGNALQGRCTVYPSDAMVQETKLAMYPDVTVTCGAVEKHTVVGPKGKVLGEAIINPVLVVEVL